MLRTEMSCEWCGKVFLRHPRSPLRSYCSAKCSREHRESGFGPSKVLMVERRAKPPGPKGCTTVEEWLAKGGQITRCPAAMPGDTGGIPVRPARGTMRGDGAVRSASSR